MTRRILLFTIVIQLFATKIFAQCAEVNQPKVLLVGDSWAFFMDVDKTFNNALKKYGHSNYKYLTNTVIAENGAETNDFLLADKQHMIDSLIKANPSIEVVHLSIGGNDVLGDWKVSSSSGFVDTLFHNISTRMNAIVTFIKTTKPGIKIVWSGYVYPNFGEVIQTSGWGSGHPFYSNWQKMEFPTFIQLNTMLNRFSDSMEVYSAGDPQVEFYKCTGLLQNTFGQTTPLGIAPSGTYAPYSLPMPEGDPNYPSPKTSMRDYGITRDCFHLSPQGYNDFIEFQVQKFYQKYLMDDLYLLSENNTQTGSVSSSGAVADSLLLGESSGNSFSSVLSFNTANMADTTLKKASIFLRRKSLAGTNPISNTLSVKVKSGNFGSTVNVEAADYSATGDASGTPCLFGSNAGDGNWIRLDLPASVLPLITKNATTQFVISAPSFTGGVVSFNNSSNPEYAPILNLVYGGTPTTGIRENESNVALHVYPNPANNQLNIETNGAIIQHIDVIDVLGNVTISRTTDKSAIDISFLPADIYTINVSTNAGMARQQFVKQ